MHICILEMRGGSTELAGVLQLSKQGSGRTIITHHPACGIHRTPEILRGLTS